MFPSKLVRSFGVGSLALAALSASGCSSDKSNTEANPLTTSVIREGTTTTAALNEFLGTAPDDWAWAGGQFKSPMDMAVLPADMTAVFTWDADPTSPPGANDVLDPSKQQGQVFLLLFTVPSSDKPVLSVFTSLKSYTPDATNWQKLVAADSDTFTLSLTSGTFENDQLTNDGGPHAGQIIHFTIQ